jgi:hypothetical protein
MKMFEGVSITDIFNAIGISPIPPDPAIAVRPTQVVKMTNGAYQVYNKETGQGLLEAPMALANIWTRGDNCKYVVCTPILSAVFCWPQSIDFCKKKLSLTLPLPCPWTKKYSTSDGDPIALFVWVHGCWVLMQFAVCRSPYYLCFAVSETEDATGAYHLFKYSTGRTFPDVSNSIHLGIVSCALRV